MGTSVAVKNKQVGLALLVSLILCAAVLIVCGFQACSGGSSPPPSATPTTPVAAVAPAFPLVVSGDQRYLQDQNGVPFPILGRTAWFLTSLSERDYKMFIDDTLAKGFNAIEFHVINHDGRGNHPPFGPNNLLPFALNLDGSVWTGALGNNLQAPNFSQPNEVYWAHVDAILTYAESKGILCFMFPAYTGYQGGSQGWMQEMLANGTDRMKTYGKFIASRYRMRANIVWMLGGDYGSGINDFTGEELAVENAMLAGMKDPSVGSQASLHFSAEWETESIYTDQVDATLRNAGTLQGAYSHAGQVNPITRRAYAYSPPMPTFLLEEPYDEEGPDGTNVNSASTQPVRRYQWWGWLSGIGGYIVGNGYVWPFNPGWETHLDTQGARDMARLNAFIRSIPWWSLIPSDLSGMKTLIPAGNSIVSNGDYIASAASNDGTLLVAYIPPDHSGPFTVDMTVMSGSTRARWFNPATAKYTLIGSSLDNTSTHDFLVPGDNGTGFNDWVLILDRR